MPVLLEGLLAISTEGECAQEMDLGGTLDFESREEGHRRQAWNIVGLLLHVGRPALPVEHAELSKLDITREDILAVARMQGSPIRLNEQGHIELVRKQVKSRFDMCAPISRARAPFSGTKQGSQDAGKENAANQKRKSDTSRVHARSLHSKRAAKRIATQDNNAATLAPVPVFLTYDVVGEGTAGGYGTVYKVKRKSDGQEFAMKCPLERTPDSLINNEICMLHKFRGDKFIVQCDSVVHNEKARASIVMQYIDHDAPKVLKNDITVSELRSFAFCLFNALRHMHVKGVAHRDIKLSNFLFSRQTKQGCLIDFNLALDFSRPGNSKKQLYSPGVSTLEGRRLGGDKGNRPLKRKRSPEERLRSSLGPYTGTKGYRAPEVLLRSMHQTTKVDVWAAGVTLMNLIVGHNIFAPNNADQALLDIARMRGTEELVALAEAHERPIAKEILEVRHRNHSLQRICMLSSTKDPRVKNQWPPALFDLLEKCLQIDPNNRIDAGSAVQHEFFDC